MSLDTGAGVTDRAQFVSLAVQSLLQSFSLDGDCVFADGPLHVQNKDMECDLLNQEQLLDGKLPDGRIESSCVLYMDDNDVGGEDAARQCDSQITVPCAFCGLRGIRD